jgi:hypothetical protein
MVYGTPPSKTIVEPAHVVCAPPTLFVNIPSIVRYAFDCKVKEDTLVIEKSNVEVADAVTVYSPVGAAITTLANVEFPGFITSPASFELNKIVPVECVKVLLFMNEPPTDIVPVPNESEPFKTVNEQEIRDQNQKE